MKILGIGNDIVEIERIEKAILRVGFIERVFSEKEIDELNKRGAKGENYAGKFAAKEAISKALGTGVRGFNLVDIEILKNSLGKPEVYLNGSLSDKNIKIELSISHSREYAVATAIAFKEE